MSDSGELELVAVLETLDWKGHSTLLVPRESYEAARGLLDASGPPPTEEAS